MKVVILAHTTLKGSWGEPGGLEAIFTGIRTCYSKTPPSKILTEDIPKYFVEDEGRRFKNLFERVMKHKHHSVLEHSNYTFSIEGVSRALLAQLTRHRHMSFSVQSQRYNSFKEGFKYVTPETVKNNEKTYYNPIYKTDQKAIDIYNQIMEDIQVAYNRLREIGIPAEDARNVLPQASTTNLVVTMNLRALMEFYSVRQLDKGAQDEIAELAEMLREEVVKLEPWLDEYFEIIKGGTE